MLCEALLYEKHARKMLMKLIPGEGEDGDGYEDDEQAELLVSLTQCEQETLESGEVTHQFENA